MSALHKEFPPLSPLGSVGICTNIGNDSDINLFMGKQAKGCYIRVMRSGLAENCFIDRLEGGLAKNCVVREAVGGQLEDSDCGIVGENLEINNPGLSNFGTIRGIIRQRLVIDQDFMAQVRLREIWRNQMRKIGYTFEQLHAVGISQLLQDWHQWGAIKSLMCPKPMNTSSS